MTRTSASALTIGTLAALLASPAFAQTLIDVDATAAAEAGFAPTPLAKPLDAIRARAQEIKQNVLRSATATPPGLPAPLRLEARPIKARAVETATSTPRGAIIAVIRSHIGGIRNRLENVLAYLSRFLTRIDSRLEKMEAAGKDVTTVAALVTDAEASISLAEEDVAAIGATVGTDDDRVSIRTAIGADVQAAQESVRRAHEAVRDVIEALVAAADSTPADAGSETTIEIE